VIDTETLLLAGLVLALLCAVLLLAPKLMRAAGIDPLSRPGRRIAVIEAAAIDPRRRLVLARCDGREVLLLVGGAGDTVVGWLPAAARPSHLPAAAHAAPAGPDELA
jgi:flagellar protein FliO/FliZ